MCILLQCFIWYSITSKNFSLPHLVLLVCNELVKTNSTINFYLTLQFKQLMLDGSLITRCTYLSFVLSSYHSAYSKHITTQTQNVPYCAINQTHAKRCLSQIYSIKTFSLSIIIIHQCSTKVYQRIKPSRVQGRRMGTHIQLN